MKYSSLWSGTLQNLHMYLFLLPPPFFFLATQEWHFFCRIFPFILLSHWLILIKKIQISLDPVTMMFKAYYFKFIPLDMAPVRSQMGEEFLASIWNPANPAL